MKTIIKGNSAISKGTKYFKCENCGWAGSADKGEYSYGPQWEPGVYVHCPCCGRTADEIEDSGVIAKLIRIESQNKRG